MFGYVNVHKPELKMKDYYKYKAYYCGLCRTLQEKYGPIGQMTLTYDMTFFVVLLTSLYESNRTRNQRRCTIHPVKKHNQLMNEITEYAADMNIAMSYHHFMDDWQDDRSIKGFTGAKLLKKAYEKIVKKYPRQCQVIERSLQQLHIYEKNGEINIDHVAGCFGELMGELLVYREDIWADSLRKIGFFLGKFIYIIDAYEDLKMDIKKGNYNPLVHIYESESYEFDCSQMLTMMMAECTSEFEKLPCVIDIEILRNILYVGVWEKYDLIQKQNSLKAGTNE